jgi:hypothetical protein
MRRSFIPFAALALLLGACQQDVVVNTPTTPPSEGFVSERDTPAPTSANTVDEVPDRDMRMDTLARPQWLRQRIQTILATRKPHYPHCALSVQRPDGLLRIGPVLRPAVYPL